MKKLTAFLMAVILTAALFAGCSGKSTGTSNTSNNTNSQNSKADPVSKYYADLMKTGKYLMHYTTTITSQGQSMQADATIALDGKSSSFTTVTGNAKSHIIIKDKTIYMLNDSNKTYFKMDVPDSASQGSQAKSMEGDKIDTSGLTYVGSGKAVLNGKELNYEEYNIANGTLRYYFDNNKLYAIVEKTGENELVLIIVELSDKVTSDMFEVPAGYTESKTIMN